MVIGIIGASATFQQCMAQYLGFHAKVLVSTVERTDIQIYIYIYMSQVEP